MYTTFIKSISNYSSNYSLNKMLQNIEKAKPYCKVCHDAGKPESEYANHWVKDLNGKTICPTLLNTECRYCFKRGHTTKFCSVLAKNNKEKEKEKIECRVIKKALIQKKPLFQNKPTNGFAVLCNDDDEEEITNIVFGIEKQTSWAEIVAKPNIYEETKPRVNQKSWADWSDSEDEEDTDEL
jgi:hypothetical protein